MDILWRYIFTRNTSSSMRIRFFIAAELCVDNGENARLSAGIPNKTPAHPRVTINMNIRTLYSVLYCFKLQLSVPWYFADKLRDVHVILFDESWEIGKVRHLAPGQQLQARSRSPLCRTTPLFIHGNSVVSRTACIPDARHSSLTNTENWLEYIYIKSKCKFVLSCMRFLFGNVDFYSHRSEPSR